MDFLFLKRGILTYPVPLHDAVWLVMSYKINASAEQISP